jgi:predicted MFS family arabinose efflux permease
MTPSLLTGLLLVDIGESFGYTVGVMGQIQTASFVVAFITALLLGGLTVKYNSKTLLISGLLLLNISAVGCGFAPNLSIMVLFYALSGTGSAIIVPMAVTLVADYFTLEKRARVIGLIMAGATFSMIVGSPIIGYISVLSGWRMTFLVWLLPLSLLSLIFTVVGLPTSAIRNTTEYQSMNIIQGIKEIVSNRSVTACLIASALYGGSVQAMMTYGASFFRETFHVSTEYVSFILLSSTICAFVANLVSSRFIDRFGRKISTIIASLSIGIMMAFYHLIPIQMLSVSIFLLIFLFVGILFPASNALTLEQIPEYRGPMMSLSSASEKLGSAIGISLGGYILLALNWQSVGIFLGGWGIAAALILFLYAIDPSS